MSVNVEYGEIVSVIIISDDFYSLIGLLVQSFHVNIFRQIVAVVSFIVYYTIINY